MTLNWAPGGGDTPIAVQLSLFGEFTLYDGETRRSTVQHCTRGVRADGREPEGEILYCLSKSDFGTMCMFEEEAPPGSTCEAPEVA